MPLNRGILLLASTLPAREPEHGCSSAWSDPGSSSATRSSPPTAPGARVNYDRGQITYDASGRMSAHLMHSSNKADASPATDELRAAAFRRYLGYYGPFVVDTAAGTVTHIVEGSSNPSWVGSKQLRYFELSSDNAQLTLSLRDGTRTTQSLVWKRSRLKRPQALSSLRHDSRRGLEAAIVRVARVAVRLAVLACEETPRASSPARASRARDPV